jgi:hypothetical protein
LQPKQTVTPIYVFDTIIKSHTAFLVRAQEEEQGMSRRHEEIHFLLQRHSASVNPACDSPVTVEQGDNLTNHDLPNHGVV